jgi:hypothetical protein
MSKFRVDVKSGNGQTGQAPAPSAEETEHSSTDLTAEVATIGVVAVGVAVVAAELLPGVVIGVAAAMAPKYMPRLGERLEPVFKSTVRGAYKLGRRARFAVGEMQERVNDIAAEVKAEEESAEAASAAAEPRPASAAAAAEPRPAPRA